MKIYSGSSSESSATRASTPASPGFDADEIGRLLIDAADGLTDPDEVPAAPEVPGRPARGRLDPRPAPAGVRRQHRPRGRGEGAEPGFAAPDGHRSALRHELRPGLAQRGPDGANTARTGVVLNDHRADWREAWALFPGDVAYVWHGARARDDRWPIASSPAASRSAPRSSGPSSGSCSGGGTTTGSTSRFGMRCGTAPRATGQGTGSRQPSGRSRAVTGTGTRCAGRRSRSSACAGRSRTAPAPAKRSTSRSAGKARRSSRRRYQGGPATRSSSRQPTSMWR
jgi:hypothetical protein